MELIVGTDSTWSLRVWICAQLAQANLNIQVIDLGADDYKSQLNQLSPSGLVPALVISNGVVHDSLAISEYLNEVSPGELFPDDMMERAIARSLCAELHAGFFNLRRECPFTLEAVAPLATTNVGVEQEITRLTQIFEQAKLPYMFERAGAVDAFYAILAFRLHAYGVELEGKAGLYQQSLLNWHLLKNALQEAHHWQMYSQIETTSA